MCISRFWARLLTGIGLFLPTMLFAVVNSPFQIEQIIDLQEDHAPYHLVLEERSIEAEGDIIIEQHILASRDNKTEYDLTVVALEDEQSNTEGVWKIWSIDILTPDYLDQAGIHVGSSVSDFYTAYPQAQAYYAPEADILWLTSEKLDDDASEHVDYIVSTDSYEANIEINSDIIPLERKGFSDGARITRINIW